MPVILELFLYFLLVGAFSFGGGMSMMALIEQIVVVNKNWLSEESLYQFIGIAESTPGPIAVNIATFIGYSQGSFSGAVLATLGVVIPSFVIILLIAVFFDKFSSNKVVDALMKGIKPVVLGLLCAMCVKMFFVNVFSSFSYTKEMVFLYKPLIIIGILLIIYYAVYFKFKKKVSPFILITVSGIMGLIFYLF